MPLYLWLISEDAGVSSFGAVTQSSSSPPALQKEPDPWAEEGGVYSLLLLRKRTFSDGYKGMFILKDWIDFSGFHLITDRNALFVYFCFTVQTFCNKTRLLNNLKNVSIWKCLIWMEIFQKFCFSCRENLKKCWNHTNWDVPYWLQFKRRKMRWSELNRTRRTQRSTEASSVAVKVRNSKKIFSACT